MKKPTLSILLIGLQTLLFLQTTLCAEVDKQLTERLHQVMRSQNKDYNNTGRVERVGLASTCSIYLANSHLESLTVLKEFNCRSLRIVRCSSNDWSKIGLEKLGVKYLEFIACKDINDFSFIKECPPLDNLGIQGDYKSFPGLQGARLKRFFFASRVMKNIQFLEEIDGLQDLTIFNTPGITDFSPLQDLGLTGFALTGRSSFGDKDTKYLSKLRLRRLCLPGATAVKSLSFLSDHPDISSLTIPENTKDYGPIGYLRHLRYLYIGRKQYTGQELKQWLASNVTPLSAPTPVPKNPIKIITEDEKQETQPQENAELARIKAERQRLSQIKSELKIDFDDCKNALAMIECRNGAVGSGFVVKDFNGEFYLYTNQHVIQGTKKFSARTIKNRRLKPVSFQVSNTRDVVRFKLDPDQKYENFLQFAESTSNEDPVVVYGNSGGGGVFTSIYGRVAGVGPDRIEVTAKFIPGNSGSPILDAKGKVVGIATYMTRQNANADWTVEGTRFGEIRRFAFRVDPNMKWVSMRWKDYQKYATMIEEDREFAKDIFKLAVTWLKAPYDHISEDNFERSELRRWIKTHNSLAEKIQKVISGSSLKRSKKDSINRTAKSYTEKSTNELAAICTRKAKYIRMKVKGSKSSLTDFLKDDMLLNAEILEAMAKDVDKYGTQLSNQDAVVYKQR